MKTHFLIVVFSALLCACALHPGFRVTEMNANDIKTVSDNDLCATYNWTLGEGGKTKLVLSEIKRRKIECEPAAILCNEAGIVRGDARFPACYIQAKGMIMQNEAAEHANSVARQANIQNNLNANKPRTCSSYGNHVTCY